jgi:hypothetical protein
MLARYFRTSTISGGYADYFKPPDNCARAIYATLWFLPVAVAIELLPLTKAPRLR